MYSIDVYTSSNTFVPGALHAMTLAEARKAAKDACKKVLYPSSHCGKLGTCVIRFPDGRNWEEWEYSQELNKVERMSWT